MGTGALVIGWIIGEAFDCLLTGLALYGIFKLIKFIKGLTD